MQGTDPGVWLADTTVNLSIAAAIQESADGDCAAATKQWKGALKTIGDSLPPAYTPGEDIYKSLDVVSLMNMYTPKDGVAVTCTVIQCPYKNSSTGTGSSGTDQGTGGGTGGGSSGAEADDNDRVEDSPSLEPEVPAEPQVPSRAGGVPASAAETAGATVAAAATETRDGAKGTGAAAVVCCCICCCSR